MLAKHEKSCIPTEAALMVKRDQGSLPKDSHFELAQTTLQGQILGGASTWRRPSNGMCPVGVHLAPKGYQYMTSPKGALQAQCLRRLDVFLVFLLFAFSEHA